MFSGLQTAKGNGRQEKKLQEFSAMSTGNEILYITDTDWQDKWLLSIFLVTATNLVLLKTELRTLHYDGTLHNDCFPTVTYMSICTLWDNYISIFSWIKPLNIIFNCMIPFYGMAILRRHCFLEHRVTVILPTDFSETQSSQQFYTAIQIFWRCSLIAPQNLTCISLPVL